MISKKMISNILSILVMATFMLAQVGPVYAAPSPVFGVRANEDLVEGWDWQNGSTVTIDIDRNHDGTPEISGTALVRPVPGNPDEIRFEYNFRGEYDILAGDKITVTDGTTTKETYVSVVSITDIDLIADTVSGVSVPETNVDVAVCNQSGCYHRHVAAAAGIWQADFAHAGPGDDEQDIVDIVPDNWVDASHRDDDEDNTSYGIHIPNPRFQVRANEDRLEGSGWEIGDTLTIEVSRPAANISDTVVVGTAPWNPDETYFDFRFDGAFDILPGDLVSVTDGDTTKTTTVTPLAYTAVDMDLDVVSGLASLAAEINIWACEPNGGDCHNRHITADGVDGTWQADFGNVGAQPDEQTTLDFVPGTRIDSEELDLDSDSTMYGYNIPNPFIEANRDHNWVNAREWPTGASLTMEIDDISNGLGSADYTRTATMEQAPWNPGDPNDIVADFDLSGFTLKVGDVVTVTGDFEGSPVSKVLVISALQVTSFDLDADTVSGQATPGAHVEVCVNREFGCLSRTVTADATSGEWTADYAPEHDLQPGQDGWAVEFDPDSDRNQHDWRILNPHIEANRDHNWVNAREWPTGASLTMEIDDISNGLGSADYTRTATMEPAPWNPGDPNDIVAVFDLSGFTLKVGDVVTVTGDFEGSPVSKVLVISALQVTSFDLDADTISGLATPGAQVEVCVNREFDCLSRTVTADATSGEWTADYAPEHDLQPGQDGWAAEFDPDSDRNQHDWRILNPHIDANRDHNWVQAREWPNTTLMTMEIDDVSNGLGGVDYTRTATMGQAPWNPGDPNDIVADFDLSGFTLKVGDVVTVTGAFEGSPVSKVLVISALQVTSFDLDADTISGLTTPGAQVEVCVNREFGCLWRTVTADATSGEWTADYAPEHDLQPGQNGSAEEFDPDSDRNIHDWNIQNPHMDVWFASDSIDAYDWPDGDEITLIIEDPATPTSPDYTDIATSHGNQHHFNLEGVFDFAPGMVITIESSYATKQLTVVPLSVTQINLATDVVGGQTVPNQEMWMYHPDSCCRGFQSNDSGAWQVDYSVVGPGGEPVVDIVPGSSGAINAHDADGDNTSLGWTAPEYPETLSIQRASDNPTSADSVNFTVTFTEPVTGVEVNDFAPYTTGSISGVSITGVNPVSGSTYTVTVAIGVGIGTLSLNIPSTATIDTYGNPLAGLPYTSGEAYEVNKTIPDTTPPTVVSSLRADTNPTSAASVAFTVSFSEDVKNVTAADFELNITGTLAGAAVTTVTPVSASVYTVTVSTGTGSGTLRLDLPATSDIEDLAGNPLAGLPYTSGEAYLVRSPIFSKTAPVYAAPDQLLSPTLSWEASFGANSYEYCYSSTPGPCTQWHSVGTDTSITLKDLAAGYTYYWQVRAVTGSGTTEADAGTWWSFTTTDTSACTWPAYTAPVSPTFGDVPMTVGHWSWVERLANSTITAGCGAGNYCPFSEANRAQMAIFLLRAKHCGSSYIPPAVGDSTGFWDVPLDASYAPWVKQLAAEGVTAGCGGGNFCPLQNVNRAQMAIFLLRARHGATYSPPAVGASIGFSDVPVGASYAPWVVQLAAEGVTAGCGDGNFCPLQNVNRAQMATFLVRAFGLP